MRNSTENCILHANSTLENTQMLPNANNFVPKPAKKIVQIVEFVLFTETLNLNRLMTTASF